MRIEEAYEDVLQNLEFAIVQVYHQQRNLLDYDVGEALDGLISDYKAAQRASAPRPHRFTERPERVYDAVKHMCEWRLGHTEMPGMQEQPAPLSVEEILACLKRIKQSVQRWNKQGGRQGYLQFISQFFG